MSIRKKIKKRLPIFGRRNDSPSTPVEPSRPSTPVWMEPEPEPQSPRGDVPVADYIQQVISENKIVLFMKGSPAQPQCGFSANAAGILSSYGQFAHVDVIVDFDVREAIKDFSQWPTLPQIYIKGEFVGGSDILSEMHQDGSLTTLLS